MLPCQGPPLLTLARSANTFPESKARLSVRTDRTETRQRWLAWLRRDPGAACLKKEREVLDEVLPNLFGYRLLQVGDAGDADLLARSRITYRTLLGLEDVRAFPGYPRLRGAAHALPISTDSIDILVLPHVLEFSHVPQAILREADRVLVPEGHLLILAFDPWHLSGAWQLRTFGCDVAPWRGTPPGVNRLRRWLGNLGFDTLDVVRFPIDAAWQDARKTPDSSYHPAIPIIGIRRTLIAKAYFLLAKKRVTTLTLIGPRHFRRRPKRDLAAVGMGKVSNLLSSPDRSKATPGKTPFPGTNAP